LSVKAVTVGTDGSPAGNCPPGVSGELAVKGPSVFPGYLRPFPEGPRPDAEGVVFDGWLLTGDRGRVDEDGYVFLDGRIKELIIRGGHNIDPRPVEESLLAHSEVTAAAVVGAPDPRAGEVPVAYVALRSGSPTDAGELLAWARQHAPEPAAAPCWVGVLGSLPATAMGKVYKPALVMDATERTVRGLLGKHGLEAQLSAVLRDGRPHVIVRLAEPAEAQAAALAVDLGSCAVSYEIA
jgi:fatty-acyl-CoA synthase